MMYVRLDDGSIQGPARAESESGDTIGDGVITFHPGDPSYDKINEWLLRFEADLPTR